MPVFNGGKCRIDAQGHPAFAASFPLSTFNVHLTQIRVQ